MTTGPGPRISRRSPAPSPTASSVYLPKLTYPIRVGTHFNTAFAMILALDWAEAERRGAGGADPRAARAAYYGGDRNCPAWEPGGDEFLSSALTEALLMRRTLPDADFRAWFAAFLPELARGEPRSLFTPAFVSDRSDGKIAHLDGVNLSRAWCWRGLADALDPALADLARGDRRRPSRRQPAVMSPAIIWASIGSPPSPCSPRSLRHSSP